MRTIKAFPTLYGQSSKGATKQWNITVLENGETYIIRTSHGYVDKKQAVEEREVTEGKNIGKANETTPREQALSEAESRWKKKQDKNYTETIGDQAKPNILPMLAHSYEKRKHNITWPCYVQPKLNGVRCLAKRNGRKIQYISRGGKQYETLDHLTEPLLEIMEDGQIFDGEIFTTELTFQEICSAVKGTKDEKINRGLLQYWIYDIADAILDFEKRICMIYTALPRALPGKAKGSLVRVPTYIAENEEEMMAHHRRIVANGYEGSIIRNKKGLYKFDHRSADLQKYKDFLDEEFQIIGGKEATGEDKGTVVFRCKTKDDKEFDVRPRGSRAQRKRWLEELDSLISKNLTVRYQNLSDDGVPVFPVGLMIRDYEN